MLVEERSGQVSLCLLDSGFGEKKKMEKGWENRRIISHVFLSLSFSLPLGDDLAEKAIFRYSNFTEHPRENVLIPTWDT